MERATQKKKRDASATRAAILAAAYQRFLRESYDSIGLRDIAGDAGINVALIGRYFGGKEGLFREVLSDDERPKLFREPKNIAELPEFLAQLVTKDADADRQNRMERFIIMLRSASSPKAGDIIHEMVHSDILSPLAAVVGPEDGQIRAEILLAILMGAGVLQTIMRVDHFGGSDHARSDCVQRFRRVFEAALSH